MGQEGRKEGKKDNFSNNNFKFIKKQVFLIYSSRESRFQCGRQELCGKVSCVVGLLIKYKLF